MAFGFFRRRQKMVIIVMAILMVSFLIGFQGFEMIYRKSPDDIVIGKLKDGLQIKMRQRRVAEDDLRILEYVPTGLQLQILRRSAGAQADVAYALLLEEARKAGSGATDADIKDYLDLVQVSGAMYSSLLSVLKAQGTTEARFRQSLSNWLAIRKAFEASLVRTPPSEQELEHLYRDITEKIGLKMVKISSEDLLKEVKGEPTDAQIDQQFNQHRTALPQTYAAADLMSFGFGYRQPDRVKIAYILVREDILRRVVKPDEEKVREYYIRNRDKFVHEAEPTTASSQPTTTPSQPTQSAPAAKAGTAMTFTEAKPTIIKELSEVAVRARLDEMMSFIETAASKTESGGASSVFEQIKARMTLPATEALAAKIPAAQVEKLNGLTLEAAMDVLPKAANLKAICYPWGRHGDISIDPAVKVGLRAEGEMTLGEVLEQITRSILAPAGSTQPAAESKKPMIEWALAEGVGGALFPIGGTLNLDLFPIEARETTAMTPEELRADEVLGKSNSDPSGRGQDLSALAFNAEPFNRQGAGSFLKVGAPAPLMYVRDEQPGRMLWQLTAAEPAYDPQELTPAIRWQVVRDLKTRGAFELAMNLGKKVQAQADREGLEAAAKANNLKVVDTGAFTRRRPVPIEQTTFMFPWMNVPKLELPAQAPEALRQALMNQVFSLVPAKPEGPEAQKPSAALTVPVAPLRTVAVVQRTEYEPPVADDYQKVRAFLSASLQRLRTIGAIDTYFSFRNIVRRVGFEPAQGSRGPRPAGRAPIEPADTD